MNQTFRRCPNNHEYFKSSDCPVCPICEKEMKFGNFLDDLAAPARRALVNHGIGDIESLSKFSKKEILELHGMGPCTIPKLEKMLEKKGLGFMEKI